MKKKYLSVGVGFLILVMIAVSLFNKEATQVSADSKTSSKEENEVVENIYVEIKGAVNSPGVYTFKSDQRVFDAIEIAGGLVADANIEYINQSRVLEDQMLIVVMTNADIDEAIRNQELIQRQESEVVVAKEQNEIVGYDSCYSGSDKSSSGQVSLNNASKEELMTLTGIGEVKADSIISYRSSNGGFKNIEELMNVDGIGEATFNKIKDNITL